MNEPLWHAAMAAALAICGLTPGYSVASEPPTAGAEAVRLIDWSTVDAGAPIPSSLPNADSNDPLEAGFAARWIERSLRPVNYEMGQFALSLVALNEPAKDTWADSMTHALRAIVAAGSPDQRTARVFCNALGCLCYVEHDVPMLNHPSLLDDLRKNRAIKPLIADSTLSWAVHPRPPGIPWELIVVERKVRDLKPESSP
jgi:hypothetical protein